MFACTCVAARSDLNFNPEFSTDAFRFLEQLHRSPIVSPDATSTQSSRFVQENYFTQRLDHFNLLDDRTWQQVCKLFYFYYKMMPL
jgi:hypothetical protein